MYVIIKHPHMGRKVKMRIDAVKLNIKNPNFRADNKVNTVVNPMYNEDSAKLKLGLALLAVIGSASIGYSVVKKHNPNAIKRIKNSFADFKNLIKNKPATDAITKKLNGKRDAQAVKIYKGYRAQGKLTSMHNKLLNGQFDGKPAKVFEHLRKNEQILQQQAKFAL